MKNKPSIKFLVKSFVEFVQSNEAPPPEVSDTILSYVKNELSPKPSSVFIKLSVAHFFSGAVTLFFCPQFGVSPFHESMGVMHYFMGLGPIGCALSCGSFLLGLSVLCSSLLLRAEELRVVRQHGFKNISVLVALTYGLLMLGGGEAELLFSLFWALGATLSGYLVLSILPKGRAV